MHIVMISITTWIAAMMVETVVDVTSTHNTAQSANALIQIQYISRLEIQSYLFYQKTCILSNRIYSIVIDSKSISPLIIECEETDIVGDGFFDDETNNIQCDYDGGD